MNIKLGRKILAATLISLMMTAIAATPLAAEEPLDNSEYLYCCQNNQSNWSRGRYSRRYNFYNNQIETLNGKVLSVDTFTSRRGITQGVHLLVDTGKETVGVHLAPSWYLENRDFELASEDKITIEGSRINLDGETAIIARQIKKGNEILTLRDENGFPLWNEREWRQ